MSLLQRKLGRDLVRLWGPALTIALVVACAAAALITTQASVHSLQVARDRFYAQAHMADVVATVRRAPRSELPRLQALGGVALIQATIERPVRILLPGQADPVMGHVVGVPSKRPLELNQVWLRQGSATRDVRTGGWAGGAASGALTRGIWPGEPTSDGRVPAWVSEGFAQARGLRPGSSLKVLMNGRLKTLEITALALAPDVIFAGAMGMPDPAGYGVLWIDEDALAASWDLEGAFTRLAIRLAPGVSDAAVRAQLDAVLPRWGGRESWPLRLQPSHQMLDNEIQEQRLLGTVLPLLFAGVSVFLLHGVMTRLVATQRDTLAALMALGFRPWTLALHQLQLVWVVALLGLLMGATLGQWTGHGLVGLYAEFFRFPALPLVIPPTAWAVATALALGTAALGVGQAMRTILRLSPAQAMQAPVPTRYARARLDRWMEAALGLSLVGRMVWRQLRRHPWRTAFGVTAMASAMALVIMGHFFRDAIEHIVARQFDTVWRGEIQAFAHDAAPASSVVELQRLGGVIAVEGSRTAAATLVHGHRSQRVQLRGWSEGAQQQRLVDLQGRVIEVPPEGLVITDRLARKLGLQIGDRVRVRLVESPRPEAHLTVTHLLGETMGLSATVARATLNRLMQEGDRVNAWSLLVQKPALDRVLVALGERPRVAGAFSKSHLLRNMQAITARNVRIMSSIMTGFALVVTVGVVFNVARIALAERAWELASLRVLGMTRTEVARLMVGEQAALVLMALPLGMVLGWLMVWGLSWGLRSDQFQFPVVIWPRTHALAALTVVMAAAATAAVVWRRILHLDMVSALKTRE